MPNRKGRREEGKKRRKKGQLGEGRERARRNRLITHTTLGTCTALGLGTPLGCNLTNVTANRASSRWILKCHPLVPGLMSQCTQLHLRGALCQSLFLAAVSRVPIQCSPTRLRVVLRPTLSEQREAVGEVGVWKRLCSLGVSPGTCLDQTSPQQGLSLCLPRNGDKMVLHDPGRVICWKMSQIWKKRLNW